MINWMSLVSQGRAKAYEVSWTEEEIKAITNASPAEREFLIEQLRAGKTLEQINLSKGKEISEVDSEKSQVEDLIKESQEENKPDEEAPVNAAEVAVSEQNEKVGYALNEIVKDFSKLKQFAKEQGIDVKVYTKKAQMLEQLEKIGITL